jgi:hypothetical protein
MTFRTLQDVLVFSTAAFEVADVASNLEEIPCITMQAAFNLRSGCIPFRSSSWREC